MLFHTYPRFFLPAGASIAYKKSSILNRTESCNQQDRYRTREDTISEENVVIYSYSTFGRTFIYGVPRFSTYTGGTLRMDIWTSPLLAVNISLLTINYG